MKKPVQLLLCLISISLISFQLFSQKTQEPVSERYIIIDDIGSFFTIANNTAEVTFELYNIYENESSKPIFIEANKVEGLIKISIKSNSEKYENQRSCFLRIDNKNYTYTFMNVLKRMKVKYIKTNNEFIETDTFFQKL